MSDDKFDISEFLESIKTTENPYEDNESEQKWVKEDIDKLFSQEEPAETKTFPEEVPLSSKKSFFKSVKKMADSIRKKSSQFIENIHIEAEEKYIPPEENEFDDDDFFDEDTDALDEKTKPIVIEKPGFVIKKSQAEDGELEGAPTIMSADNISDDEKEKSRGEFGNKLKKETMDGQIIFSGFDNGEEKVEHISEEDAEKELFKRRKEQMDKFVIFKDGDSGFIDDEKSEKLGELFEISKERPRKKDSEKFDGVEYVRTEDEHRVLRYLRMQKKKSSTRLTALGAILALTFIISIASSVATTVGGDRILTIFSGLIMISLALVVSNQTVVDSFEKLRHKEFTLNTAVSLASILCFFQNLLMLILYFFDKNTVSVFSGMGVVMLFLSELNKYIVLCRTIDTMEMCTGKNTDRLFSIEGINDDKDAVELAKNVKNPSPRIRYSCKARFPSHLIELCMSETAADKIAKLSVITGAVCGLINLIISWVLQNDFSTGFAAFVVTFSLCIPAYGALLYELPLRWINRRFNKSGGMISCQTAVEELCRTNVIMLDSRELFDRDACTMHGFKDFKNVRVEDSMLYAAALVIRSGGPLVGVFDSMVKSRRDILPAVKSFSYEDRLGISGWINEQKVILGTRAMMITHDIQIPETVDEEKYLISGHEVLYLAIAHKLAAMIVVDYAPDEKIAPMLKTMRDSGVTVLVNNCDPNVTEEMISSCYDMRLNNIKILNSTSGRVFKKYKSRPKMAARAMSIHDGTPYSFMKSLCLSAGLRRIFKVSDMLMITGTLMGFVIMLIMSVLQIVCDLPAVFAIAIQMLLSAVFFGILKLIETK